MSEPVLNAIMRLFALVAKEDLITKQEREHVLVFLSDHLSHKAMESQLRLFDEFAIEVSETMGVGKESELIANICSSINKEVAQKQKIVIVIELMSVILADGTITERERSLAQIICKHFNISESDLALIEKYVISQAAETSDDENILIIHSQNKNLNQSKLIKRGHLDGFISILHIKSSDTFFFKYLGNTDVYLNGVPQKSGNI
ncbi:MAG: hypothetical protein RI909_1713, partial [Bacteroidota bacterium]